MPDKIKPFKSKSAPSIEDNPRRAEDRAFYKSARWRRLRGLKLKINPICECSETCGQFAQEVHHVIDRRERPDLAYDLDNLEALTTQCHSKITRERQLMASRPIAQSTTQSDQKPQGEIDQDSRGRVASNVMGAANHQND